MTNLEFQHPVLAKFWVITFVGTIIQQHSEGSAANIRNWPRRRS